MSKLDFRQIKGVIVNYRIGSKGRNTRWRQVIIKFDLPSNIKIDELIGKKVEVHWRGKVFKGKLYRKHGKYSLRALFEKSLPGQVLLGQYDIVVKE
ncbi:MAG: 50S ribosomal protein L35ae [Crenarchaeota archaeon]|nr:50S ribosomal protein L35ae [Thermoproteota archaeon]MCR8453427.1 50S ribosomal protein L35ae [Thermoproteota archaeon]MCR8454928.1 50S ribosomal protein L35ae [Thermoproteota archaeon]MCR8463159.1 50S ribosomal protein L35ae [Thermoproteota archaeon]MCR8470491.1 50S ribosomal protein L35ae [Thermoproteota archaeon]